MANDSNFTDIFDGTILNTKGLVVNVNIFIWTIVLSLTTAVANLGTIIAFWKVKGLGEKPSDLLILSLAFVDIFQGLILIYKYQTLINTISYDYVHIWTLGVWRAWLQVIYRNGLRISHEWPPDSRDRCNIGHV
jgi:hypothetical protein